MIRILAAAACSLAAARRVATLGGVAFLSAALFGTVPAQADLQTRPQALVELFTSQGCSSCPPADELLADYIARDDVIGVSLPVDYWDYLGWKDTFAQPAFSRRQRAYALQRADNMVYTPQVVVNGMAHAVGSRPGEIDEALQKTARKLAKRQLLLDLTLEDDRLVLHRQPAHASGQLGRAVVWMAQVTKTASVAIGRGENHGRKVTYHNIVRELKRLGDWPAGKNVFRAADAVTMGKEIDGCIIFIQDGDGGAIIGAHEVWEPAES